MSSASYAIQEIVRAIARHPVLSREQEQAIAQEIQRYLVPYQDRAPATEEERLELARGLRAKHRLTMHNLGLVVELAKKYQDSPIPLQDLIQQGMIGLNRAAEKFDPTLGYRFSTYAWNWIRSEIQELVERQSTSIRLPQKVRCGLRRVQKVQEESMKTSQPLSLAAAARQAGVDPREAAEWVVVSRPCSLNLASDEGSELGDFLPSEAPDPIEVAMVGDVVDLLNLLSKREREVLRLRFGLEDGVARKRRDICDALGLTRGQVERSEREALQRLRSWLA